MSCVILNTMKLCISHRQRDISGGKGAVIHDDVVNIERRRDVGLIFFGPSFMSHFKRPIISYIHS